MKFRLYLGEAGSIASTDLLISNVFLITHPDVFLLLASSLVHTRMTMGELVLEYPC